MDLIYQSVILAILEGHDRRPQSFSIGQTIPFENLLEEDKLTVQNSTNNIHGLKWQYDQYNERHEASYVITRFIHQKSIIITSTDKHSEVLREMLDRFDWIKIYSVESNNVRPDLEIDEWLLDSLYEQKCLEHTRLPLFGVNFKCPCVETLISQEWYMAFNLDMKLELRENK